MAEQPSRPTHTIPSHPSPLSRSSIQQARDEEERDRIRSSIDASNRGRQIAGLDAPNMDTNGALRKYDGWNDDGAISTPLATSRAHSPYTSPALNFQGLSWPSVGTEARKNATEQQKTETLEKLSGAVRTILECVGENPDREGLKQTPDRYAKALLFFTKGYEESLDDIVNGAIFHEDHDELVIVKDIEIFSLCEHHLVPFTGKMHIGYIPNRRVIGLSKLARIAEMFSRRFQVQERLTKQVALALSEMLKPQGVAVVVESSHLCMVMRGVQKTGATTTTSCMLGRMRSTARTREEFLNLINRR